MPGLSPKQTEAWWHLEDPEVLEVFAGEAPVAASHSSGAFASIYRRLKYPGTRGFIGRDSFTALRDSTMYTYFKLLAEMGYRSGEHYSYNAQDHTVKWGNGSEQHFRHMAYMPSDPDYNRFGSTEYTDAFVDEAPEVALRLSGATLTPSVHAQGARDNPELLYTGNPGESWIKEQFVMDQQGRMVDLPKHRRRVLFTIADNPTRTSARITHGRLRT